MKTIDRTGSAVVTLPSDRQIEIVRKFDAPAEPIFDVWTTPEHVNDWWGCPEHPMTVCVLHDTKEARDARVQSGMEDGLQTSLDGAEAILADPQGSRR